MATWNTAEAQIKLPDLMKSCVLEPQMLSEHADEEPIAVILDIRTYKELIARRPVSTMAELHEKLKAIRALEPDIEIPERFDRPNPLLEKDE